MQKQFVRTVLQPNMSLEGRIKDISVTESTITTELIDEQTISIPLTWSWRLSETTPKTAGKLEDHLKPARVRKKMPQSELSERRFCCAPSLPIKLCGSARDDREGTIWYKKSMM